MAAKWGHAGTLSVSSASGIRDDKKTSRSFNLQQVNEISLLIQGQQTVQDIVGKATDLFRYLEGAKVVVDEKSKAETRNNNKKVQETLNGLKELFSRLRVIYDESNRRIDISQGENLEVKCFCKDSVCVALLFKFFLVPNFFIQFNFYFPLFQIMIMNIRQRKIKLELVWKFLSGNILNHKIYQDVTSRSKSIIENVVDKSIILDICG